MIKVLLIANYKPSVGGISGQVEILSEKFDLSIFNTKQNNLLRLFLPFLLLIKGFKYKIFHIHGCSGLGFFPIFIGVIVGKLLKKKIIITYHGGGLKEFIEKKPKFGKFFLMQADKLTVPSTFLQKILKEFKINSILLPNVIRNDNVLLKQRNKITPIFVTTRSLETIYNIFLAIDAFNEIVVSYPEAKLYIVGDGSLRKELEKHVKDKKIRNVRFVGRVSNTQIGEILNEADIYINPTRADSFSVSMFEAFACGLPVISTNVGAIPNFIKDGFNGYLIESNNVNQLVEKIKIVLNDQVKTKNLIKNGYETFQKYTWEKLKVKYQKLYLG